jgi:hypothetical protein
MVMMAIQAEVEEAAAREAVGMASMMAARPRAAFIERPSRVP